MRLLQKLRTFGRRVGSDGSPALEHFRLITEGPAWGVPLGLLSGVVRRPSRAPYKLFEVVEGAVFEYRGDAGVELTAELTIRTSSGRRLVYRTSATADHDGLARLRVPYASATNAPTRPVGPYTVRVGGTSRRIRVSDAQVRQGAVIPISGERSLLQPTLNAGLREYLFGRIRRCRKRT